MAVHKALARITSLLGRPHREDLLQLPGSRFPKEGEVRVYVQRGFRPKLAFAKGVFWC